MKKAVMLIIIVFFASFSLNLRGKEKIYPENPEHLHKAADAVIKEEKELTPGVIYRRIHCWTLEGPLEIHILNIDLDEKDIVLTSGEISPAHDETGILADSDIFAALTTPVDSLIAASDGQVNHSPSGETLLSVNRDKKAVISPWNDSENGPYPLTEATIAIRSSRVLLQDEKIPPSLLNDQSSVEKAISMKAAGLLNDEELIMIVCSGMTSSESIGLSPLQSSEYLRFLGCRNAVSLAGKTEHDLLVRFPGMKKIRPVSTTGGIREKSPALIVKNKAEITKPDRLIVKPENPVVLTGEQISFDISVVDRYNHILAPEGDVDIRLKPDDIGTMEELTFTASENEGEGEIIIRAYGEKIETDVRVVSDIKELRTEPEMLTLFPGEEVEIKVRGITGMSGEFEISPESVNWNAPAGAGEFVSPGKFKAGDKNMVGFLTARVRNVKTDIPMATGSRSEIITDFGSLSGWDYEADPFRLSGSYDVATEKIEDRMRVVGVLKYDFSSVNQEGTASVARNLPVPGKPVKMGLWCKSQGPVITITGAFRDSLGVERDIVFSKQFDKGEWTYIEESMPEDVSFPVTWKKFSAKEVQRRSGGRGWCRIRDFKAIYPPQAPLPEITEPVAGITPSWLSIESDPDPEKDADLRFLVFGNSRISREEETRSGSYMLNIILKSLENQEIDYLLTTGNIAASGQAETLELVKNKFARFNKTVHSTLGVTERIGDPEVNNYPFVFRFTHYKVVYDDIVLFVLDNTRGSFKASDPQQKPPEKQWPWLLSEMSQCKSDIIFVSCHLTPTFSGSEEGRMNLYESEMLHMLLHRKVQEGKRVVVFSGDIPGFHMKTKDGVVYVTTGGAGTDVERPAEAGGFYNYLQVEISGDNISLIVRPIFSRLVMKWSPMKRNIGVGEELDFDGSGIWVDPASQRKKIIPLVYPMSYKWSVTDENLAEIEPRDGKIKALSAGHVGVKLDMGNFSAIEGINIVSPE